MVLTRTKTDSSIDGNGASKRQKTAHDNMGEEGDSHFAYDPEKNAHLKGRRRFKADLQDLEIFSAAGYVFKGLKLSSIGEGDDDGSFVVGIEDGKGKAVLTVSFLVSDTSEYPKSHSLFAHSLDPDISSRLEAVVESVVDQRARPLKETVDAFFASVASAIAPKAPIYVKSDSEDEDSGQESETYDYDDLDDDIGTTNVEPKAVRSLLQANFNETVASSYTPGLTRISGGDDFILSVSIPIVNLAQSIPPRALMAWDRRLLAESQHLVLLISGFRGVYPILENDGSYTSAAQRISASLSFKVGLSPRYKPGNEQAKEAVRKHGLIIADAEDELRIQAEKAAAEREAEYWDDEENMGEAPEPIEVVEEEAPPDMERFDKFSLSSSLESLLDQAFLRVVQFRRKFGLGWAGAEALLNETEKNQVQPEEIYRSMHKVFENIDKQERNLQRTLVLPDDPLFNVTPDQPINLPLTAFSYLIRRLTLCTKYCIVCHNKINTDYESLKPYVCDNKLCSFQYFSMNRGPSLEYEIIHNTKTVDLLVSLAYCSASEGAMQEPLPIGLGLRVPHPGTIPAGMYVAPVSHFNRGGQPAPAPPPPPQEVVVGPDGLVDFDTLSLVQMRAAIAKQIDTLPPIESMKKHLERKVRAGKSKPKLRELNPSLLPAAWLILRWIVCSCTALVEEITSGEEHIQNLDTNWKQYRLTVGAPDAEAKFKNAVERAVAADHNAKTYPVLYAFHGSPLRNWHSIIRHGLWYKSVAHGRAFGDGIYLAKDATTSMSTYAVATRTAWKNSQSNPTNCVALAEVVNLPNSFVSKDPHYVIADTTWVMCRYLLIKGSNIDATDSMPAKSNGQHPNVRYVDIDPSCKTTFSSKSIQIPDPAYQVEQVLRLRQADIVEHVFDDEDMEIFNLDPRAESQSQSKGKARDKHHYGGFDDEAMDVDDDEDDYKVPVKPKPKPVAVVEKPKDDWKHNEQYVQAAIENLMLPPFESTPGASMALQKELRGMLKEQDAAKSLRELGWYMPPDLIGDNLYQWIVEMHSFDPDIPIAKDMKKHNVNSIIFEIRFPPTFPISPPFFRIITPRFLPFIHGGGGHVTGGGSICMDLLTADGWLPSYNIPAILMQIKLAISNLDPRPARLAPNWQQPYSVSESLAGFKRAAATHGWTVPQGLDRLVR